MGAPAFDTAPIVCVAEAAQPKMVQLVYPYYENPSFLEKQITHWLSFPHDTRTHIRACIVDDGSPVSPAVNVIKKFGTLPFSMRLFRVDVDVRWNWLAARNIGMHHASSGWCMLTDMDHMLGAEEARRLMFGVHDESVIYRFSRREYDGRVIHPHPNSMFMTRSMYWKVGGYDEALSGFYGTDGDWRRRCAATAKVKTLSEALERHEHVGDSSTTKYLRKQKEDAGKKAVVAARRMQRDWKPLVLSFPYHEEEI